MTNSSTLKKPVFTKDPENDFFLRLRQIVHQQIEKNTDRIYLLTGIKVIGLFLAFFGFYALIFAKGSSIGWLFTAYIGVGITSIMLFLNVVHDAAHNALFRNRTLNKICVHFLEMMGTNSFIWKMRHVRLHHSYPNIPTWDCDVEQSNIAKIFPNANSFWYNRYQHLYLPVMYFMYTLNWLFVRDFRDFFNGDRIVRKAVTIPKIEYVKLFVSKILYIGYMLALPMLILPVAWYWVFLAFLAMHFVTSGMGLVALLSTHAGEHAIWTYPEPDGRVKNTWAYHQMLSTNDFAPENKLINFTYGCFNHHVAHHLFPTVSHVHYPAITRIIRDFAQENNLPYRCYNVPEAITSHFKLLRNNALHESVFEETM